MPVHFRLLFSFERLVPSLEQTGEALNADRAVRHPQRLNQHFKAIPFEKSTFCNEILYDKIISKFELIILCDEKLTRLIVANYHQPDE